MAARKAVSWDRRKDEESGVLAKCAAASPEAQLLESRCTHLLAVHTGRLEVGSWPSVAQWAS